MNINHQKLNNHIHHVNNNLNYIKLAIERNMFHFFREKFNVLVEKERNKANGGSAVCSDGNFAGFLLFDSHGNFPLSWAAMSGHLHLVQMLVEEYFFPLDFQNYEGNTALATAVIAGYEKVVSYLLENGANPNIVNIRKESPLHFATCFGNWEIASSLISHGAWIDTEDDCGDTPLHWAVRENNIEVIEYLVSKGANIDHPNEDDESPKDLAESVSKEIFEYFESRAGFSSDILLEESKVESVPESPPWSPNEEKYLSMPLLFSSPESEFYIKPAGEEYT